MSNKSHQENRGKWLKKPKDRGLYLRGKTWYVRFADQHGRLHVEKVGPSKDVASKVYQSRKAAVSERRFFPATDVTIDEIIADAITRARENFEIKYPDKKFKPGNYGIVATWFAGRQAASITTQEIAAKLAAHCALPATYNRFRVAISHAYKIAVENKKVAENPARLVKLLKENNDRVRYLNQFPTRENKEEEVSLRAALRDKFPLREPEVDLALHTGMRWGEQYGLSWDCVDLERAVIKIAKGKSSGKDERIPVNAEARRALLKLRALSPQAKLVCPDNNYDRHRDWWLAALLAAGITDFHWHDLRHSFASRLVMNGVDIFTVNRLMRHKNIQITMRYAHLADKHLKDAVEKLAAAPSVTVGEQVSAEPKPTQAYVH